MREAAKVMGNVIMILGAIPFALLLATWVGSIPGGSNVVVYPKLLIVGGIVFCTGFAVREWGQKAQQGGK